MESIVIKDYFLYFGHAKLTHMKQTLAYLVFILIFANVGQAQNPPFEFGKIKAEDMDLTSFQARFAGEPGVILGDMATCHFEVNSQTGSFNYVLNRTIRYMILSPEGSGYGDFPIPFYQTREAKEEITGLRGFVYNLEGGKIQRERIKIRDGLVNDMGNNWKEMVIPFPAVRTGSVIELQYTIKSSFLHVLPKWNFQREIPVLHSEFKLRLPALYIYRVRFRGMEHLAVDQEKPYVETLRIPSTQNAYGLTLGGDFFTVNVNGMEYLWIAKDIPALRSEPYVNNPRNYRAAMDFELVTRQFPESPPFHYSNSWESVRDFLFKDKDFGGYLEEAEMEMFHATGIKATDDFGQDLEQAIREIQKRIRWNNKNALFAENTPSAVVQQGSGNSAEVNLMLCGLLRNMGYKAEPVVLSTVDNGDLFDDSPTLSKLNYIIIAVESNPNEYFLLDATESAWPPGFLPSRVLNGKGRFLSAENTRWIDLNRTRPMKTRKTYSLNIDNQGNLSGKLQHEYFEYSKFFHLKEIEEAIPDNILDRMARTFDIQKNEIEVTHKDFSELPLTLTASLGIDGFAQVIGNEIILSSLLFETQTDHPFSSEEREYPVHFIAPRSEEIIFEINIPEGYEISHLPREQTIRGRGGFFYEFQPGVKDNQIMIRTFQESTRTVVEPQDYTHLKSFYDRIIRSQGEKIIITGN